MNNKSKLTKIIKNLFSPKKQNSLQQPPNPYFKQQTSFLSQKHLTSLIS